MVLPSPFREMIQTPRGKTTCTFCTSCTEAKKINILNNTNLNRYLHCFCNLWSETPSSQSC